MPRVTVATTNPETIDVEYEAFGSDTDPVLLLVMGFTAQLTAWDEGFCAALAAQGRYVIRFDNRDCGLSTHLDGVEVNPQAMLAARLAGEPVPPAPYDLTDMGNDAIGLLDALDIEQAHLVGASMGGMLVQTMALDHPDRCLSMTSIMSSPGDPRAGKPTKEALAVLMTPPPSDRDAYVAAAVTNGAVTGSKRYYDPARAKDRAEVAFDRAFYPEGAPRQLAAIYASGDRTERLHGLEVPTLVLHGRDDTLITPSGGTLTAEAIPGANFLLLADMGHDIPAPLWRLIVPAIIDFQDLAASAAS
jgi:pimeloyl-ACP methyl ester carboxylesterase